ncbi:MAG: ATP-binding protein [Lachnobacterium sp.]|nr:ATP-binding protein [Lachnobacterium sp.]MDD6631506.1 ATP-binding protein [Lachnobacterium sp.]MDY2911455.1 ATP-binding protein [Agathobacter sp.]
MKRKINTRLVLIAILAVLASTISTTIVYYNLFQRQIRNDLSVSAKLLKDTHYFETSDINPDNIDLSTDISELRVTWVDTDGTVLYDNDASTTALGNHSDRPEIQEAFENGVGECVRRSNTMNKNTFYYAVLLDNKTVLRVSTEVGSIWSVFLAVSPMIMLIVIIIVVVCIALSHMLTRQLIAPIEKMAQNMEDASMEPPYKELVPFASMIRKQHTDILSAAKARQDFSANVSHELKTPLTAISGYAELIEAGMVDEEKQKHFIQEIRKNAQRLLSLINDIIRLSELDRTDSQSTFDKFDLNEIVSECMEALDVNAKNRQVTLEYTGEKCNICGSKEMMRELTDNLVQNAIRYNKPNGSVWVEVHGGDQPRLVVKDNGIGIPADEQQRIFERFYRVDKSRSKATGGTGLGLAIVKHIVEIHDAKLSLESELGQGTTITVNF